MMIWLFGVHLFLIIMLIFSDLSVLNVSVSVTHPAHIVFVNFFWSHSICINTLACFSSFIFANYESGVLFFEIGARLRA